MGSVAARGWSTWRMRRKTTRATLALMALTAWALVATAGTVSLAGPAHADPAACDPGALAVAAEVAEPGLGHRAIYLNFTLQPGAGACQLSGYPTVDAQPNVEGASPIRAKQVPSGYLGGATPGTIVTLEPGHGAHAMVEWVAAITKQDSTCQIYGASGADIQLQVTPPGTSQMFDVPISVGRNEGLCNLVVHPLTGL